MNELYENWRAWTITLDEFTPRRIAYEIAEPALRSFGYSSETVVSYVAGTEYFSRERDAVPIAGKKQKGPVQCCHLFGPKYFCILGRGAANEPWIILSLEEPREKGRFGDPFRRFIDIPGDIPRSGKSLDALYKHDVVDADKNNVTVKFSVNSPKLEFDQRGMGTVDEFVVTFSESCEWLPCRMDRHFRDGDFWFSARYSDWRKFDDTGIPAFVSESNDRSGAAEPFLTFHVSDLSRVPESAVVEHCSLSFYGISELDGTGKRRIPWLMLFVAAVVVAVTFIFGIRRKRVSSSPQ